MNNRRLYRSADDRILAGVAGGLAAYFDVDPVIVRVIWFFSVFVTGSLTFWIYLIMIVVVPLEPAEWPPQSPWMPGGAPVGYQASYAPPGQGTAQSSDADATSTGTASDAGGAPGASTPPAPGAAPNQTGWMPGTPPPSPGGWWGNEWGWQGRQSRWQQHAERRAERWQQRAERRAERDQYRSYGGPGLAFGVLLIIAGGLLALNQFIPNFGFNVTWPLLIIALGVILVASSVGFRHRD